MTFHSLTIFVGWLAVLVGFFAAFAQFRRAETLGIEGVSLATWVLFVFMGLFWVTYGLVAHSWEVVMGSLVIMPLQVAILFRLRPWENWRVVSQSFVFFLLCCALPTVLWGWPGGVYGTGIAMVFNRAPQLIELIRHADASGVSVGSWSLGVVGCSMWIIYYSGVHLWAALASTACAGLANLAIAVLAGWRHAQARRRLIARTVFAA